MTPNEETRVIVSTLVKSFHDTNYPTMEVNYPFRFKTDVEHASAPFVTVELDMQIKSIELGNKCYRNPGTLALNIFARSGSGLKLFTNYTDFLNSFFANQTLNGITFYEVNAYSNKNIPGFDGQMNIVTFYRDFFNT